ncbi:MAG: hypothetical protein GX162_09050 [Firmicutes bacterium]|jgi:hypothetical protein|nr:hypothetical protein [Bacillota bacterium]
MIRAAAAIVNRGRRLERLVANEDRQQINRIIRRMLSRTADSSQAITEAVVLMQELVRNAIANGCATAERYESAVSRYDTIAPALDRHTAKLTFAQEAILGQIEQYTRTVQTRLLAQIDRLIDNRFDSAVFQRILIDEVLAQEDLLELLRDIVSAESRRLDASWRKAAASHALTWTDFPLDYNITLDEAIHEFLKPIQLHYERPSAIRSVFLGLGRGKLQDKLIREVSEGMSALTQAVMRLLEHAWQEMAAHYKERAVRALHEWLRTTTGFDRESCIEEAAVIRHKVEALKAMSEQLDQISLTDWLVSKQESLRQAALKRIVWRLESEHRVQA